MDPADILAFSARSATLGAELWPAIVLIAGVEYAATVPAPRILQTLVAGGQIIEGALSARISQELLATAPAENQPLSWKRPGETSYRADLWWVDEVRSGPLDTEWHLLCSPKN